MLRNNLSVLLAQRNLKITKVSEDTGISRTTLTALNTNSSQGIQFDTLNKLCLYLRITPDDFFSFLPYDITIHVEKAEGKEYSFLITLFLERNPGIVSFPLFAFTEVLYQMLIKPENDPEIFTERISRVNIRIGLEPTQLENIPSAFKADSFSLINYFSKIPFIFKKDIEERITTQILQILVNDSTVRKNIDIEFFWPDELA